MTIDRLPAIRMIQDNRIAAIAMVRVAAVIGDIVHAVADAPDGAIGGGLYGYAVPHRGDVAKADVGAVVLVFVDRPAATVILHAGAGIAVDVILDETVVADVAIDGPLQRESLRLQRKRQKKEEE